jgi:hypothetical protein
MDVGVGNWGQRKKLEKVKHSTQEGQAVQQNESELFEYSINPVTNIVDIQRVCQKHAEHRGALRSLYQSKSMINQQGFCQLQKREFQDKIYSKEKHVISEQGKDKANGMNTCTNLY